MALHSQTASFWSVSRLIHRPHPDSPQTPSQTHHCRNLSLHSGIPRAVQKGYSAENSVWSCSGDTGCLLPCLSLCVEVGISPRPITPLLRPSLCGRRWAATSASAVSESVDQVAEWLHRHHVFSSPWQGEGARGPWPWQAGKRTGHSHKHTSECDQGQRTTLLLPWRRLQQ